MFDMKNKKSLSINVTDNKYGLQLSSIQFMGKIVGMQKNAT